MHGTKVYVGDLSNTVTELDLHDTFERFGCIDNVSLVTHRDTNAARRAYAFITFTREDAAEEAVVASHDRFGVEVQGNPCVVEWPRQDKSASNRGSRGDYRGARNSRYSPEPRSDRYDRRRSQDSLASGSYTSSPRQRKYSDFRDNYADECRAYSPPERQNYSPDSYYRSDRHGYGSPSQTSSRARRGYGRRDGSNNMEYSSYSSYSGRGHVSRYGRRELAPLSDDYDSYQAPRGGEYHR